MASMALSGRASLGLVWPNRIEWARGVRARPDPLGVVLISHTVLAHRVDGPAQALLGLGADVHTPAARR